MTRLLHLNYSQASLRQEFRPLHERACNSTGLSANGNHIVTRAQL
jgi:hypothetical protein